MMTFPFQIRAAEPHHAAGIARVHVDTWRTTYDGLVAKTYLDSLSYESREKRWIEILNSKVESNHNLVVLNLEGNVIGFSSTGKFRGEGSRFEGELYAIYILKQYQKRGIGRTLFFESMSRLKAQNFKNCFVWVLFGNPAQRFYESLGAKLYSEKWDEIAGVKLKELGYGWEEIPEKGLSRPDTFQY